MMLLNGSHILSLLLVYNVYNLCCYPLCNCIAGHFPTVGLTKSLIWSSVGATLLWGLLTWFGAEGFPQRLSRGCLWFCCCGSRCVCKGEYKGGSWHVSRLHLCTLRRLGTRLWNKRRIMCPHVAPASRSWETFLDKWDVNTHTACICDTCAQWGTSAGAKKKTFCACAHMCVCVHEWKWVRGCWSNTCLWWERSYPSTALKLLNRIIWDNTTMIVMRGRWVCACMRVCVRTHVSVCLWNLQFLKLA